MNRQQVVEEIRIESCTSAGRADNLPVVIGVVDDSVWIAPYRRQSVNHSFCPDDGLKLENLRMGVSRVRRRVLRNSADFPPIAYLIRPAVAAAEGRALNHFPFPPQER